MDRSDVDWKGYWAAVPTPFDKDGTFNEGKLRTLLEYYIEIGVHGILVNGSSGEWFSQSHEERKHVAKVAAETVAKRVPVMVGISDYTPQSAISLGKAAEEAGADGLLASPPPCAKPDPDELINFYRMISDSVALPLAVYNIPALVSTVISVDTLERLADEVPNVVAVKNEVPADQFIASIHRVGDRLRLFDSFLMRNPAAIGVLEQLGGDGFINGGAILGREEAEFFESVWSKDYDRAREIAAREREMGLILYDPKLQVQRYGRGYSSRLKAVMKIVGQDAGYPRLPLLPVDDPASIEDMTRRLDALGLIPRS